jgi:hypothetical protein
VTNQPTFAQNRFICVVTTTTKSTEPPKKTDRQDLCLHIAPRAELTEPGCHTAAFTMNLSDGFRTARAASSTPTNLWARDSGHSCSPRCHRGGLHGLGRGDLGDQLGEVLVQVGEQLPRVQEPAISAASSQAISSSSLLAVITSSSRCSVVSRW